MQPKHVAPRHQLVAFHCPHCGVYAQQEWGSMVRTRRGKTGYADVQDWSAAQCEHCGHVSLWQDDIMWYPLTGGAPEPHPDLPAGILPDYDEARSVLAISPRAAAALLRLTLQKLCAALGEHNENLNDAIGSLVEKGLDPRIQQALDSVRIVGNNAVHPGQIDIRDDLGIALKVFALLNIVVEEMITKPALISGVWAGLPEGAKQAVERRDRSDPHA